MSRPLLLFVVAVAAAAAAVGALVAEAAFELLLFSAFVLDLAIL
jgi:hypothetical protein